MPRTFIKSSFVLNEPFFLRYSIIAFGLSPTPFNVFSSSTVAVLIFTFPSLDASLPVAPAGIAFRFFSHFGTTITIRSSTLRQVHFLAICLCRQYLPRHRACPSFTDSNLHLIGLLFSIAPLISTKMTASSVVLSSFSANTVRYHHFRFLPTTLSFLSNSPPTHLLIKPSANDP